MISAFNCLQGLNEEQLECLRGCSKYTQFYAGLQNFLTNVCPFCEIDCKLQKVLYDENDWIAWEVPQIFTTREQTLSLQLLFFPKHHHGSPWELTDTEAIGRLKVTQWAKQTYGDLIIGGGIISRFGDMRYNVGTIMHMHETMLVPNRKGQVIVPLQKSVGCGESTMAECLNMPDDTKLEKFLKGLKVGRR